MFIKKIIPIINSTAKKFISVNIMAKSKYEYVRDFEQENIILPNCWFIIRLDGKGFHKFSAKHKFEKPNDKRALNLMSRAAASVMEEITDILLGYGQSDEYSFVFKRNTEVYNRRTSKIVSVVTSLFTSAYVFYWNEYFTEQKLIYPPSFDGRVVLYPKDVNLRDYLSWRQVDCHVNNLYNTCFWALVLKKKCSPKEAEQTLKGTLSSFKNEMLFQEFNTNYNNEPELFRKGTTLIRKFLKFRDGKTQYVVLKLTCDIISDKFWEQNEELLSLKKVPTFDCCEPIDFIVIDKKRNK